MPCSPRTARVHLDCLIDLAKQADHADFQHAVRIGGVPLTIRATAAGEGEPLFIRGADMIVSKRFALQLIETYHSEARR